MIENTLSHNTRQAQLLEQFVRGCIHTLEDIQVELVNSNNLNNNATYYLEKGVKEIETFWLKIGKSISQANKEEIVISDEEVKEIKSRVEDIKTHALNEYHNFIKNAKHVKNKPENKDS